MPEEEIDVTVDTSTEGDTQHQESGSEDTTDLAGELEKQRKANAQIVARAKKAEAELKLLKSQPQTITNNNPQLSEELKLIARGLTDEEIDQAKVIAKGKGVVLTEAIKDPLFTLFQDNLKEVKRKEDAKLGASKGSGESIEEVTGTQSGASREEHLEAFKKITGTK